MCNSLKVIGETLKKKRQLSKLSQKTISEATGLDRALISKIETGVFTGSLHKLIRYLDYMGLELTASSKALSFPQFEDLDSHFKEDKE